MWINKSHRVSLTYDDLDVVCRWFLTHKSKNVSSSGCCMAPSGNRSPSPRPSRCPRSPWWRSDKRATWCPASGTSARHYRTSRPPTARGWPAPPRGWAGRAPGGPCGRPVGAGPWAWSWRVVRGSCGDSGSRRTRGGPWRWWWGGGGIRSRSRSETQGCSWECS